MDDYLNSISRESDRVAGLIVNADLQRPVPGCPDWTMRDLLLHLGEVQRFWAETVLAADASSHWDGERVAPESDGQLEEWFRQGSSQLIDAITQTSAEAPCWTWWGDPHTVGAVARHQVQEAAVHRWDVESCIAPPQPIDGSAADDGVSEFLEIMMRHQGDDLDHSVGLASTDTNSIWLAGPPDAPQAATITATASDLVLLFYGRVPLSVAHIDGDPSAAEALLHNLSTH